jgi:hypothetical protein
VLVAYAVPLAVLPSGLWRLASGLFTESAREMSGDLPSWMPTLAYMFLLSVVSELLAFTAVGLVARWGEVFPRWVPVLRGRRVPVLAAVVPAAFGAVANTVLWTTATVTEFFGVTLRGERQPADYPTAHGGWEAVVFQFSYLPLLLWGPLLGVLTVAYYRRRRAVAAPATS